MAKKLTDYNLDDLYAWVESNYTIPVSEELMQYANLLDKIRGMILRKDLYGTKEAIIKYLIEFEPSLKGNRLRANEIYAETIEWFYANDTISQKAWKNFYASELEKAYYLALELAETSDQIEKATKILERAYKFRGLDIPEVEKPDALIYQKPNKVYTLNMDMFEIGNVPKDEIEQFIDQNVKGLPVKAIERIKQEALISKIKVFEDDGEDSRK